MASSSDNIPVIDISALMKYDGEMMEYDENVFHVIKQINKACMENGFFYVKGHGIPNSLLKEVRKLSREFFTVPLEEKLKIKLSPATGYRGYQEVGDNLTSGKRDMQEAIDCYKEFQNDRYGSIGKQMEGPNLWPSHDVKIIMENYVSLCKELAKQIMRAIVLSLGGTKQYLEERIAQDPFWVMRLNGYPGNLKKIEDYVGCGIHTDYGFLTLLNQDENVTALRVQNRLSGEWIWAPPIPDTFVCNIGDMIQILSNGIYQSTPHQVVNNSDNYRVSVAFFYEPEFDSSVQPLDVCIKNSGGTSRCESQVYGIHLTNKVKNNFKFEM